jgi:hypothetical protein
MAKEFRKSRVRFVWDDPTNSASANVVRLFDEMDISPGTYHFSAKSLSKITGIPEGVILSDDERLLRKYKKMKIQ